MISAGAHNGGMTAYLISFPASAMGELSDEALAACGEDAHAVVDAMRAAGVYVFAGGIDGSVPPVRVAGDGGVTGPYAVTGALDGGFCVIDVATRAEAEQWAARLAQACRCDQELRAFGVDARA